jgi:predicted Fe-Mo cluster-binding NifX family protein
LGIEKTNDKKFREIYQWKEKSKMKIAIPTVNGQISMHFGHCEEFAVVDVDEADKTITGIEYLKPPAHEPGVLPRWLHENGADVIIAGGMGMRAQGLLSQNGIKVIVGAPSGTPEEVVSDFLNKTLQLGENACAH